MLLNCVCLAGWLGATSWAVSMFTAPVVIAFCRRKSTRLTAVLGGLVLALGILFASFATQFHQVAFSYGKWRKQGQYSERFKLFSFNIFVY